MELKTSAWILFRGQILNIYLRPKFSSVHRASFFDESEKPESFDGQLFHVLKADLAEGRLVVEHQACQ